MVSSEMPRSMRNSSGQSWSWARRVLSFSHVEAVIDHIEEDRSPGASRLRQSVYPIAMTAPRARRGASFLMSTAEIATQPAVGVKPARARWKKIALPRSLARREKF
jgi:hypothetical protein